MPTITFSGLASGLDTSSWVDVLVSAKQTTVTSLQSKLTTLETQQSTLTTLETSFNTLRTNVEKLTDARFGGSLDIFSQNTANSSNNDLFTATATQAATRQDYDISVQQLATETVAKSDHATSAIADDATTLSSLGMGAGTLSVYVNGVKNTVTIKDSDTVADLKKDFNDIGVNANVNSDGTLNLTSANSSDTVLIGASNDTSNIKSLLGLVKQTDGSYKSSSALYKVSTSSKLTTANLFSTGKKDSNGNLINTSITSGSFTIGDATFNIDDNTTISGLVSSINSSSKAGVTAYWDSANSKLVLTSKTDGASYVNVEAGTSNFTDVMGLTTSTWNSDGTVASTALNTGAQALGDNAKLTINGTSIVSSSNTISSDISKLTGVTINLKGVSSSSSSDATLSVAQNTSSVVSAVKDFVTQYNSVISSLSKDTESSGDLYGETPLDGIKKSLRQASTTADSNNSVYTLLSQIGISTASAGAGLSDDTDSLTVDESKLTSALESNPDAVRAVLVGSGANADGVLNKMEDQLDSALSSDGYFLTRYDSMKSDISDMTTQITNETTRVTKYKSDLEKKFQTMESTISKMQSAYSSYLSSSSSTSAKSSTSS